MATAPRTQRPDVELHRWQLQIAWILAAGVIGFAMAGLFTSILDVPRDWWVAIHASMVVFLLSAYVRWARIDLRSVLRHHWLIGVLLGAAMAVFVTMNILQSQAASPRDHGLTFLWEIVWLGVVYGVIDALLLNVLPVYAVWQASKELGHTDSWAGKIGTGVVAVLASALVTTMYHLGFAEFRDSSIREPLIGNTLVAVSYVLSANPITAVIAHIALHVSSVVHGITSTSTLPPHY